VEITDDIVEFGAFVLAHCAAIAATNEPGNLICPFAVFVRDGNREIVDFESGSQDEAVSMGWEHFEQSQDSVDYWALGREGYFTFSEGKSDVLVVSVWKREMAEPFTMLQRFTPAGEEEFSLKGPTEFLVEQQLLAEPTHPFLLTAVTAGIARHPKGGLWSSWVKD
jgi:hypothetical protein